MHLEATWQLQGMLAVAEGLKLNTSLRQLKMGNNAANTLFGFGTAKACILLCLWLAHN